jgi:hypothetical protein
MRFIALALGLLSYANLAVSSNDATHIWPSIPFVRGADLCAYHQAYSQTRMQYMREMTSMAQSLMRSGAYGSEALEMLLTFDAMYDKNLSLATRHQYLDVTLENTLRGYLDQYYRDLKPREKKIIFTHTSSIAQIIAAARSGQRVGNLPANAFAYLDFIAYGSYAFAPDCKGDIQVTLTLVGKGGQTETFIGHGRPAIVMGQIASKIFERFQRTRFPSRLKIGTRVVTLVGGFNGSVDKVTHLETARMACETQEARLPTASELLMIDAYGDWSGGVGVGRVPWIVQNSSQSDVLIYHPSLRRVVKTWEINEKEYNYYCIK